MIGIDLLTAENPGQKAHVFGILRYVREICKRMGKIGVETNEISFSPSTGGITHYLKLIFFYPFLILSRRKNKIAHLTAETFALLLLFPIFGRQRKVVTVHETHPFVHKEELPFIKRFIASLNVWGLKRTDAIITVSGFLKKELISHLAIPAGKISVVPNAVDHQEFKRMQVPDGFYSKYKIPRNRPVILYVGSEEPRKNLPVLVRSLSLLKKRGLKFTFVKVGKASWPGGREKLVAGLARHGLEADTIIVDYVEEGELPLFYNAATVCVYPCHYAGFGLPPLEAMACGCPVVVANSGGLPEVVGNAGMRFKSDNYKELAEILQKIFRSGALRKKYSDLGRGRAAKFSWDAAAIGTKRVYADLLKN